MSFRSRIGTQAYLTLAFSGIKYFILQKDCLKCKLSGSMRRKVTLSIKEDRYFLVYIGERKREVIKLGALGFRRERISGRQIRGRCL